MFCPNCGAPNPDTALTCEKCGFNVKGAAAPKFKGTMLMMNQQGGPAVPGVTPPMPMGAPMPGAAPEGPAANSKLKGTMIGVAPPSAGGIFPPGPGPTAPMAATPGARPNVNPLDSTMAAGAGQFGYGFPNQGAPGAPAGAGSTALGVAPPPAGAPAPGYGGFDPGAMGGAPQQHGTQPPMTPPMGQPYGAQPGGFGAPGQPGPGMPPAGVSPGMGGMPPGMQQGGMQPGMQQGGMQPGMQQGGMQPGMMQPGMMQPAPGAMAQPGYQQPGFQQGMPAGAAPYAAPITTTGGGSAPGGEPVLQKSPVALFFLIMFTCGIYSLFWYAGVSRFARGRGAEIPPVWHLFIPILGLIYIWKFCKGLETASRGQMSAGMNFLMILFLGAIGMAVLQSNLQKL